MTPFVRRNMAPVMFLIGAAVVALAGKEIPRAAAQQEETAASEMRVLRQQIEGLQELKRLDVTAEQRLALARVVAGYQHDRDALSAPQDAEALVAALSVVRDALLSNEEPTPEMWQAVSAARGGEEGQDQALQSLRQRAVADLAKALTDEQKTMLAMPPLDEMAKQILQALWRGLQLPADQQQEALAQTLKQISTQMAQLAGEANAQPIQSVIQGCVNRLREIEPGQGEQQGEPLVRELVAQLKPLLSADQEGLQARVNERLGEMLDESSTPALLEDSAHAMGAP